MAEDGAASSNSSLEENSEVEDQKHGSSSYVIGISSRNTSNPFAIKTTTPIRSLADSTEYKESRPLVAPPTFVLGNESSSSVSSTAKFTLRPSLLTAHTEKLKTAKKPGGGQSSEDNHTVDSSTSQQHNGKVESSSLLSTPDGGKSSSTPEIGAPAFVFGQNLHERALINNTTSSVPTFGSVAPSEPTTFQDAAAPKDAVDGLSSSKGGSEAVAEPVAQSSEAAAESSKTLSEAAQEIQQARQQVKRKFDEVSVVTGEEEEFNVLQINCKLYSVNKDTGMYQERGRGILRLNDREVESVETSLTSRVVMRTQGSLRLILNTKVWAGMTVERPSSKTVRLTAIDTDSVRVFLVAATTKDAEQLFNALDWRVATLKSQQDCNKQVTSTTSDTKKMRAAEPPGSSDSDFAADSSTNSASVESEN